MNATQLRKHTRNTKTKHICTACDVPFFIEFMFNARLFVAGEISFDDINLDNDYCPRRSYQQSKLANVLFARELAARLQGRLSVCD